MGNFFVNFSIPGAEPERVAESLKRACRRGFVTSDQGGFVVAYEEASDSQDDREILAVGTTLSRDLSLPVLAVLNHDDSLLGYWLFDRGDLADSYNSAPGLFDDGPGGDGDAGTLCGVLRPDADPSEIEDILRSVDYAFACDRHEDLARALNLPACSVGFGFRYVSEGELEDEMGCGELIHVDV